jgi:hypothetical protein
MAFVVRHNGSNIDESQIMDFVAKQVLSIIKYYRCLIGIKKDYFD